MKRSLEDGKDVERQPEKKAKVDRDKEFEWLDTLDIYLLQELLHPNWICTVADKRMLIQELGGKWSGDELRQRYGNTHTKKMAIERESEQFVKDAWTIPKWRSTYSGMVLDCEWTDHKSADAKDWIDMITSVTVERYLAPYERIDVHDQDRDNDRERLVIIPHKDVGDSPGNPTTIFYASTPGDAHSPDEMSWHSKWYQYILRLPRHFTRNFRRPRELLTFAMASRSNNLGNCAAHLLWSTPGLRCPTGAMTLLREFLS